MTSLSHDVRTPLTTLIGYLDAAHKGLVTGKDRDDYIETARRKAHDLKEYIDVLFDWFKLNSNEFALEIQSVEAAELTRNILIDWIPIFEDKQVEYDIDIPEQPVRVRLDMDSYMTVSYTHLCRMKILANKEIKNLFLSLSLVLGVTFLLTEVFLWLSYRRLSLLLLILFLLAGGAVWAVCFVYFNRQNQIMEQAILQINAYLDGDRNARIECDNEGELYRLFHSINSLAAVLNAHADNELREKEFLKNTISDISHQLKTPLAALNIYNGLLQDEDIEVSSVKEFAGLSEQELDRIETLVQSLLKITRLDAGAIVLEKNAENVADMMRDIELHFAYRARQEKKEIILSGSDHLSLFCDRDWLNEAIDNIVKNAFDHTESGATIRVAWKELPSGVQIVITDNGCGIHPEDIHHIFKRFYRSRFSKDKQGIGLGLPLAKAIVEAHNGTIEVDSELGIGTTFTMNFLIPTKL